MNALKTGQRRNGRIEFFRFVFCMAVAIHKIISSGEPINIGRETEKFFVRKLKSLYPMVVIAFFMTVGAIWLNKGWSVFRIGKLFIQRMSNLLLLHQTGIGISEINGTWYLSSMLIAMLILFPLTLKFHNFMRRIGVGLIAFLLIGYLMQMTGGLSGPSEMLQNITYRGNVRAISEIALGVLCYEGAEKLREAPFTKLGLRMLGLVEISLYVVAVLYMTLISSNQYDFYIVLMIAGAVTLSFSKCNYSNLWDSSVCMFLGKSSLYIYLGHISARYIVKTLLTSQNNAFRMIIYVGFSYIAAAILWLLSEAWKKISPRMSGWIINKPKTDPSL